MVAGRTYHLRIGPIPANALPNGSHGEWWGAWIKDASAIERFVGQIKLPAPRLKLHNGMISWTENYVVTATTCSGLEFSDVSFTNVTVNDGVLKQNNHRNHLSDPVNCPGSYVAGIPNGARQQMGNAVRAQYIIE